MVTKKVHVTVWQGLRGMIDSRLSIARQCELFQISRFHHDDAPRPEWWKDIEEKITLKELFLKDPFYRYRSHVLEREREGIFSTPKRVWRLMHEMGLKAISPCQ